MLLSVEGAGRGLVGPFADETVSVRAWLKDGDTYVLVVNGGDTARSVRVPLGADAARGSAAAVFGPAPRQDGDAVSLDLAPLEPAFVRLRRRGF